MVTLIFLRGLCGYVWVNIFTLSPLRVGVIRLELNDSEQGLTQVQTEDKTTLMTFTLCCQPV